MAVLTLAGTLLAACGADSTDEGGSAGATPAATLTPGVAASGEPVRIGFVSAEGGSAISQVDVRTGAEAAVDYANGYLGGIAGRPVELVVCEEQEEPASARTCANRMVEEDVAAVVVGVTAMGDVMAPVITGAGIPYVSVSGAAAAEYTGDLVFLWSGSFPAVLGAMASYASGHDIASVAVVVIDVGAVVGTVQALGQPVFDKAGVELRLVPVPPGTPDATSVVSAAAEDDPGAYAIVGDETHCAAVLDALDTVGGQTPRLVVQNCVAESVQTAAPGSLDEATLFTFADVYSDDPDSVLFRTVMATFAPETSSDGFAVTGYQSMLGLIRGLEGLTGEVDANTVEATLRSAKDVPLPAGHGVTVTCDATAVPLLKAVCGASALATELDGNKGTTFEVIDAADLFAG